MASPSANGSEHSNRKIFGTSGEHLADLMVSAIRSTADGLVLVGLGEGAFLALGYVLLGVPHPALLGALTGPARHGIPFGAPIVFSLASLLLFASGDPASAIGLFAFGWFVVLVADHAIRPVLIGGAAKLPFLWVLLGIFGARGLRCSRAVSRAESDRWPHSSRSGAKPPSRAVPPAEPSSDLTRPSPPHPGFRASRGPAGSAARVPSPRSGTSR